MNRLNFSELVAAFKGGSSKSAGFQPTKPWNFDEVCDRKVVDAWLAKKWHSWHAENVLQGDVTKTI
jgi:hypothetical protein